MSVRRSVAVVKAIVLALLTVIAFGMLGGLLGLAPIQAIVLALVAGAVVVVLLLRLRQQGQTL